MSTKKDLDLKDVPETMLWTLHNRANEAMREDGILKDPRCIEIYRSIDYDYERSFGRADASHAIRSKIFDIEIGSFLTRHPDGLVIGLGEGLETQCLRCDNGKNRWLSVDLPESIRARELFIQPNERRRHLAKSALDESWMDAATDEPVFITAQGLFMYFTEDEVRNLLSKIDKTFSRYKLMFDTIPTWFSRMTLRGLKKTPYYTTPPMPWGINVDDIEKTMKSWLPSLEKVSLIDYRFPRGPMKWLTSVFTKIPVVKYKRPCFVLLEKGIAG